MADVQQPIDPAGLSFGEELRKEREIRGITLKEIADSTKISKRFLEAIERNDFNVLPAPVFTRGFIREYARYLGIHADDMVNRYMQYVDGHTEGEKEPASGSTSSERQSGLPGFPERGVLIIVILLLAVIGGGFWIRTSLRNRPVRSDDSPVAPSSTVSPKPNPVPPAAMSSSTAAPASDADLTMVLRLVENSWISLDADGESVVNEELTSGDERTFKARESFRFNTVGNAGGVELTINGSRLPALGESGEVVKNRVFDRNYLRSLKGTAP